MTRTDYKLIVTVCCSFTDRRAGQPACNLALKTLILSKILSVPKGKGYTVDIVSNVSCVTRQSTSLC